MRRFQQRIHIQRTGEHRKLTIGSSRPFFFRAIAVKLHAIAVRVAKINRLAHAVIGCAIEFDARSQHASQRVRQPGARRIKYRNVIQSGRAGLWRRTASTLPCIQSDVVVITARRKKCRLPAHSLRDFEAKHIAIKSKSAFKVGNLEMDVANFDTLVNWFGYWFSFHAAMLKPMPLAI